MEGVKVLNAADGITSHTRWGALYGRSLTDVEHLEIEANLSGFFTLLDEWDKIANIDSAKQRSETSCHPTQQAISQ